MIATSLKVALTFSILAVATLAGTVSSAQGDSIVIQAGATNPNDPTLAYEYTRYYPSTLRVHRGQTVTWKFLGNTTGSTGFHTVTFLPAGDERPGFLRADEVPGYPNVEERWFMPSACGHVGDAPCELSDTDAFISSGPPIYASPPDFNVTIDVEPGTYDYICTVHASMRGTIRVVPESDAVPTQEEVNGAIEQQVAVDTAAADAVVVENADPGFVIENGKRIHTVLLGDSTRDNHVALNQYFPSSLEIEAGDGVRWVYDEGIVDEIHTVSFPEDVSGGFSPIPHGKAGFGFHPRCDFDDPVSGAPGIPGVGPPLPTPCPANLELGLGPWMVSQTLAEGSDPSLPLTIHDSAILIPEGAPDQYRANPETGEPFPSTFDASFSNPGTFGYECNVHSDPMTGSITVV